MTTYPQPPKKERQNQDDLLRIIEDGDAEIILSPENTKGFNELIKYELVCLKDEKICLTELGKKAKTEGAAQVISEVKAKNVVNQSVEKKPKNNKKLLLIFSIIIVICLLALFLIFF